MEQSHSQDIYLGWANPDGFKPHHGVGGINGWSGENCWQLD